MGSQEGSLKTAVTNLNSKTEEARVALQANKMNGDVLKSLMQEKKCGRIKGIQVSRD
jgi:hypothetical protein